MKYFDIPYISKKSRKRYVTKVNVVFFSLLFLCFAFFAFYEKVTTMVFAQGKTDIFTEDLEQVAFYFYTIDKDFSQFLVTLDDIVQDYTAGKNIFETKDTEIEFARRYIKQNPQYIKDLGFGNYSEIIDFIAALYDHKDEVYKLLGKDEPFNYLVILQNANEKRPNGGFFGSFAFIRVNKGFIEELEIVDAYYPDFIAYQTFLTAPVWTQSFLEERKIGFIAANKYGFTDMDGKNIKDLYETMFNDTYVMRKVEQTMRPELYEKLLHQNIKGVIFIRSDLIEYLQPTFTKKVWEWQFVNASIDLIRGEYRGNKKEIYIDEIKDFFNKNQWSLIANFINNFDNILERQFTHLYLSNVSSGVNRFLIDKNLTNIYKPTNIYAWDTNNSFNKVDSFMTKNIQIRDANGTIIIDTNNDIVDIAQLSSGDYSMRIYYTLNVPENYQNFIAGLEQKYNITLRERERGILALESNRPTPSSPPRRWQTKATVYFPPQTEIHNIDGDLIASSSFSAPFAQGLFYEMKINQNNKTKTVKIDFTLP